MDEKLHQETEENGKWYILPKNNYEGEYQQYLVHREVSFHNDVFEIYEATPSQKNRVKLADVKLYGMSVTPDQISNILNKVPPFRNLYTL